MELTQQAKEIDNIRLPTGGKLKELELTPSEKKISESIFNSLPKRTQTNFNAFKDLLKQKN